MANKIQLRRDTTANWTSSNPTLSQGEIGYELTTGKIKIGTGTTAWNSLSYLTIATSSVTGTLTFPDATVQSTAWLGSLAYSSLTGVPTLATVATSGSYDDLANKPTIPTGFSFYVSGNDSTTRLINSGENIAFIGSGTVSVTTDTEGNILIAGSTPTINWGDIGFKSGLQGPLNIALGLNANAGTNSISLGQQAGYTGQSSNAVAIGHYSGSNNQGTASVAIGSLAGNLGQGNSAIAIGDQAGYYNQSANSIVLNATGSILNSAGPGFHVAPVRPSLGVAVPIAQYNTSTKEFTYSDISINGNTITTTDSNVDLVLDANSEGAVSFGSIKIKRNNIIGVNSNEDIVIDPSGTGGVVVNGSITATAATATTTSTASSVGYLGMPQNSKATSYQLIIGDMGKHVYVTATSTVTIPAYTSVDFPIGTTIIVVAGTGATVSIAITTDTMNLAGAGTTGTRTLAPFGMATLVKVAQSTWLISGVGLT
jgi:hypothetical protein